MEDHQFPNAQLSGEAEDANYFVCTLDQAAILNTEKPHSFKTVNDFIDHQIRKHPTRPAVGFPVPLKDNESDQRWGYTVYSNKIPFIYLKARANVFDLSFPGLTTLINISGTQITPKWPAVAI